jgi:hypothetical protein
MTLPSRLLFLLALETAACAAAAAPAPPSDATQAPPSDYSRLSVSERLGIMYRPAAKNTEGTFAVTPLSDSILLPILIVKESRLKLTAADILTEKAKLKIAQDRYLSPLYRVTFGPMAQIAEYYFSPLTVLKGWHPNEAEAMTLYRQDERLDKLAELDAMIELETIDNPRESKQFQEIRYDAMTSTR